VSPRPLGKVAVTVYKPALKLENEKAPVADEVEDDVVGPESAITMPGIHTSDASFTSSSSASIHTVPATEPTEFADTGVVEVGDEATVVDVVEDVEDVDDVEDDVVLAAVVVNERMIPFAVPFAFVMVTRK
jgi:hypothetical protein